MRTWLGLIVAFEGAVQDVVASALRLGGGVGNELWTP